MTTESSTHDAEIPEPAIETILRLGRNIEAGAPREITSLIAPLKAPPVGDSADAIVKLKQLDPTTLLAFIGQRSEWIPLILEALPDRRLAEVLKQVIGTFYDDLLPAEVTGHSSSITFPTLHPGRATSGFTNLQPFFDMLAATPLSVIKKALVILRRSDPYNEYGPPYVTHYLDLPPGRRAKHGVFYQEEWFVELSRRIPLESADRELILSQRAGAISLIYFENCARKTGASEPSYGFLRATMCAHAESAGFSSTQAALVDSARRWASTPEMERDGLILRKNPDTPEGISIIKGKRALQNLPPALKKDPEITRFRAEAFSLWQTRMLLEAEVVAHYFKTGELLDHAGFSDVFAGKASATLRRRLETAVPENLEKEFRAALESESEFETNYPLPSIPPFIPASVAPELIRRRWEHMLWARQYHGFYFTAGEGDEKITFLLKIIPVDSRENPKEGITPPNNPHTLAVVRSKGPSASSDHSSGYAQRVIGIVLRDLVDAMRLPIN